jgi:uncharacterized protein (TIGR03435 family)
MTLECQTVESLIRNAYVLYANGMPWPVNPRTGNRTFPMPPGQMFQPVKGSSGWIGSDRYTIDAKADSPAALEMMRGPMMQALLEDRFKLKVHREKKEVRVYELVAAQGRAALQPAKEGSCTVVDPAKGPPLSRTPGQPPAVCGGFSQSKGGGLDLNGVTMTDLCIRLSLATGCDVIDRTGIAGEFDLHLELSFADLSPNQGGGAGPVTGDPAALLSASEPRGSVFTAIRKLGLTLRSGKMTIESIVIDRVARPAAN